MTHLRPPRRVRGAVDRGFLVSSFKDHFSARADLYAAHRPTYPPELFQFLSSLVKRRELAWDCGTGNGQAAIALAEYFQRVIGTDASEEQICNASPSQRVSYRVATAEASGIAQRSVDLVVVAQALHWFDTDGFYREVRRVAREHSVLAVWCYGLAELAPELDDCIHRYYADTVGAYWPAERRLVEQRYRTIPFPFDEIEAPEFVMVEDWTLDSLCDYLRTWSATRRFRETNGYDPVTPLRARLQPAWGDPASRRPVKWPLTLRAGFIQPL